MSSTIARAGAGLRRMLPRDSAQAHRPASALELFFDLVFVVAVSFASVSLHHLETEGELSRAVIGYLMVFFAIWWAWMNFTWFATSFDTDDWLYRVTTIVQMAGVLVVAAGAEGAMIGGDFTLPVIGYIIMRLAMVSQWIRAGITSRLFRATALRYAGGIALVQVLWIAWLLVIPPDAKPWGFLVLAICEVLVPVISEQPRTTPWHAHHIAERYGLFTLILLGESLLASAHAIIEALHEAENVAPLVTLSACGLAIVAGMWWIYFSREQHEHLVSLPHALLFGYSHYVIFAAAGAISAGIEVAVDATTHETHLGTVAAAATTTVPIALFIVGIWALTIRRTLPTWANVAVPTLAVLIALSAIVPGTLVVTAALVVVAVVVVQMTAPAGEPMAAVLPEGDD